MEAEHSASRCQTRVALICFTLGLVGAGTGCAALREVARTGGPLSGGEFLLGGPSSLPTERVAVFGNLRIGDDLESKEMCAVKLAEVSGKTRAVGNYKVDDHGAFYLSLPPGRYLLTTWSCNPLWPVWVGGTVTRFGRVGAAFEVDRNFLESGNAIYLGTVRCRGAYTCQVVDDHESATARFTSAFPWYRGHVSNVLARLE